MFADPQKDFIGWDYLTGNMDVSISTQRYMHLYKLVGLNGGELKVSVRDPSTDKWTKWADFFQSSRFKGGFSTEQLRLAYDIHREILKNEIVIESDYDSYEQNYDATRPIGAILEHKGFTPHYYYSGNKSLHIHVYLAFDSLLQADLLVQDQIMQKFRYKKTFMNKFMEWLRERVISCWGTELKEFDKELVRSSHLIRSEMSKNKLGYKTFLGYSYKDVSCIPYISNEENRIYPKIGEIKLSRPHSSQELLEEFLSSLDIKKRISKVKRREASLKHWIDPGKKESLRGCVKFILSDEFGERGDGFKRAMFILCNELRKVLGEGEALIVVKDWNERMGFHVSNEDIEYRMKLKSYTLSCDYIHKFLESLGHKDIDKKCNHKI